MLYFIDKKKAFDSVLPVNRRLDGTDEPDFGVLP